MDLLTTYKFQTVIAECEALKVEVGGSVLSAVDLAMLEIAFLRGEQHQVQEQLAKLEREVA